MACGPETNLCSMLSTEIEKRGLLLNVTFDQVAPLGETMPTLLGRFGQLVDGVFSDYAKRRGKKRWVDKEVWLHKSMDLVDKVFDYRSKWLYVVRHGLDAAVSAAEYKATLAVIGDSSLTILNRLRDWVTHAEATLDFAERNRERVHLIKYEDFVADPERHARAIFEFFEEPWCDDVLERMRTQEHAPFVVWRGDNKIHLSGGKVDAQRTGRYRDLPPALLSQLARVANPTLVRLGYEPVPESGAR
jgi:hypothetical protein